MKNVNIQLTLTEDEAWFLALFLKRATYGTALRLSDNSEDKIQAHAMIEAVAAAERGLTAAGFAPR